MKKKLILFVPFVLGIILMLWVIMSDVDWWGGPVYNGKTLHGWATQLDCGDFKARSEAIHAIEQLPLTYSIPKKLIPALTRSLHEEDPDLRWRSACILSWLGKDAASAVPSLACLLTDCKPAVRVMAAIAIEEIGSQDQTAIQSLKAALYDPNVEVRIAVVRAYVKLTGKVKQPLLVLMELLQHSSLAIQVDTLNTLPMLARAAHESTVEDQIITTMIPYLLKQDTSLKIAAAQGLSTLGTRANRATPTLLQGIKDKDSLVRSKFVSALAVIDLRSETVIREFIALLKDSDPDVRAEVICAFEHINATNEEVVNALMFALDDKVPINRAYAAATLGAMKAATAVPKLATAKTDSFWVYRRNAARALGEIGVRSPAVLSALQEMTSDPNPVVRRAAATSLSTLRSQSKRTVIESVRDLFR